MSHQPFYHLRPNKSIDRTIFAQTLACLGRRYPISTYRYTGFGSYLFDDFRILHDQLNISDMISLENDSMEYDRAKYNVPYNCIEIKNITSSDYITNLTIEDNEHNIFWLDFVEPSELGQQLADFASLLEILNPNDIIRITLNANPSTLGSEGKGDDIQKNRVEKLKTRVKREYLPNELTIASVTTKEYPRTLLSILKNVAQLSLTDDPPYSPNFLLPLFSSVYADGQQMVTFTGIVLDTHEQEGIVKEVLSDNPHVSFSWDSPNRIEIPPLSVREITELNKLLPSPNMHQQLIDGFPFIFSERDSQAIESYILYYKYYPNYFKVSF